MKRFLLSVAILFMATGLFAQVHFGIKGGLNWNQLSDITTDVGTTFDNKTSWHAGIFIQYKIPVLGLSFQPELLYSTNQFDFSSSENSNFSLDYIELPINVQWGIDLFMFRPFVVAAPYISYAIAKNGADNWDDINRFNYGIGLGAGIEIWKFQLMGKYNWGLGDLGNVDTNDWELNDSKLKGFQLSLGFMF